MRKQHSRCHSRWRAARGEKCTVVGLPHHARWVARVPVGEQTTLIWRSFFRDDLVREGVKECGGAGVAGVAVAHRAGTTSSRSSSSPAALSTCLGVASGGPRVRKKNTRWLRVCGAPRPYLRFVAPRGTRRTPQVRPGACLISSRLSSSDCTGKRWGQGDLPVIGIRESRGQVGSGCNLPVIGVRGCGGQVGRWATTYLRESLVHPTLELRCVPVVLQRPLW
jgi:hypothetical protein